MARTKPAKRPSLIGQPIRRVEDERLLTGRGNYLDDLNLPGQAHACIVRSPHAHARLRGIDAAAARTLPGVLGVFTCADMDKDGVKPLPPMTRDPRYEFKNRDGSRMPEPQHWALAKDKVRYAGDCVALVVAETAEIAAEAGALVEVDYEILSAVPSAATALAKGAPRVWDELPNNTCFEWEVGDKGAADDVFKRAAHVTRLELANERLVVAYMEPRAALASYDESSKLLTLHASCQGAHRFRETLAFTLGVPQDSVRVIVGDVGGGFGPRGYFYPENLIVAWAARHLRRPVKWLGDRGESFLTDVQARGHTLRCALALDKDGRFTGLKVSSDWNLGAYIAARGIMATIAHMGPIITGAYRFGAVHFELRGVFTNTAIAYAYRGIGRAEASHALERLVDEAARETGRDRVALRRLNMVPPSAMPYATQGGAVYDSGEFEKNMDLALQAADWKGFSARKTQSEKRGRLRGIGLCNFVENAGGAPSEFAEVRVEPTGRVMLYGGSGPSGQGHETAFAQVLADELGLPFEDVKVIIGDTGQVRAGYGSAASRSMRKSGTATVLSARAMVEKGRALAGEMLEAATRDIEYGDGRFRVAGTDRSIGLYEVSAHAVSRGDELSAHGDHNQPDQTFPNGCQVAEVEIDPATGQVALLRHTLVNDVGRVINPMILDGQLHGGIAQGIGQALIEQCAYDRATGQLLSGSFMDYAIPRADEMPFFTTEINAVPCANNPLGVKGAGEGGTTGAPPAVVNAIVDALAPYGVRDIDMPATSERVWRTMMTAKRARRM